MSVSETSRLSRSFAWLNVTQFFGALNDGIFKLLVIFYILYLKGYGSGSSESMATAAGITADATAVFVLPFLLFSHAGGVLADRLSKSLITVWVKIAEIVVMVFGCIAISLGSQAMCYGAIFLMATQSAIFSPSKFGIIPELAGRTNLSRANSVLVGLTYLAIILGTFVPSLFLHKLFPDSYVGLGALCVAIAVIGLLSSLRIERTPPAQGTQRMSLLFVVKIYQTLRRTRQDAYLFMALMAAAYFLFLASFIQQNMILYSRQVLGWDWIYGGYLFTTAALGIGIGALLAGRLSGRNVEYGIVPLGAIGLTLSCLFFSVVDSFAGAAFSGVLLGISCGLFIVPINAFIQLQSPRNEIGEILAAMNFCNFIGILLSAVVIKSIYLIPGVTASHGFFAAGLLTIILTVLTLRVLPDFFIRFLCVLLTRFCYRVRALGRENVPASGPALLLPNHVTWVDALLIAATQQRRIRFVMWREMYERGGFGWLYRLMGVIPIAHNDPPKEILRSLRAAREALGAGYLVCLFPEGALTRNGHMRAFRPGFERILRGTDYPIIPVHIHGGWGSIFSHAYGPPLSSLRPRRFPYPVVVHFGRPLPATATVQEVRLRITETGGETVQELRHEGETLGPLFVRSARRRWGRAAMSDTTGKRLTYGKALISAIVLAKTLDPMTKGQKMVGVMLPATVGGALINFALTILGRTPVNLNFTASPDAFQSALSQTEITTIISSRSFLEKLEDFEAPEGTVFMEDISAGISPAIKLSALLEALFAPRSYINRNSVRNPDELATVIFSSGSTAEPKGVMLSHHNITSNIEGFSRVTHFNREDGMCAALPFFHSFGYTATLWCPVIWGFRVAYHPNPLDGAKIAEIVREERSTILLATPTFLLAYIRKASAEDFSTLRIVVTGAEKLKERVAASFEKKFGTRPLEGYGATELSPVVSLNIPDVVDGDLDQVGTKSGSIGHPIPGVALKIVDIDSGADLAWGEKGVVLVKGPNVMMGYLNQPQKTAEVLKAGWYNTGDVGKMDEDGFVVLVDRISRFSKIGGEMVPHLAIEEKLHECAGATEQVLVVTSIPDEKKGEKIMVLYVEAAGNPKQLYQQLADTDLPNLWKPRAENYIEIESMPMLGSGKLDLKTIKQLALDAADGARGPISKAVSKVRGALRRDDAS
jgi:acyl-[acyl-carrier-protein]-phospholipid O-acyltransferase/long-chain-fatty-acid--[acyl-carrier-protein] ligase